MSINFPHKPEVRLQNPPLREVVCQIRFPTILRIANEEPSDFQERVRARFPEFIVEREFAFKLPGPRSEESPSAEKIPPTYRFRTRDGRTAISLTVNFFALSTETYDHWDNFLADLAMTHKAVQSVYQPAYGTRIGLRYINHFTLENTGADTMENLLDLFRPNLTAALRVEAWDEPVEYLSRLVLADGDAKLVLRNGLGRINGKPFFLLDFDYFEEGKLNLDNLSERVTRYHDVIHNAFRWCLKDESLARFGALGEEV